MRADVPSELLSEVWAALAAIRVRGMERSIADLGFVTAASSDGVGVLVLLCMPARLCRATESGDRALLDRVGDAVRGVPSLRDVELTVTPFSRTAVELYANTGQPDKTSQYAPFEEMNGRSECVGNTLTRRLRDGWSLDGFQQGARTFRTQDGVERPETVRVIIEARVATGKQRRHVTSPAAPEN